jgi:hypothetical protein
MDKDFIAGSPERIFLYPAGVVAPQRKYAQHCNNLAPLPDCRQAQSRAWEVPPRRSRLHRNLGNRPGTRAPSVNGRRWTESLDWVRRSQHDIAKDIAKGGRVRHPLKRNAIRLNRHFALACRLSMIFSENRHPLFGIML